MHELSVASAIVSTVRDAVAEGTVEAVEVSVGAMSGVVPTALEFAWDVATAGTPLQGSVLDITLVPTTLYCADCDLVVAPEIGFACPTCGALSGDIRSGRELEVRAARVRDAVVSA